MGIWDSITSTYDDAVGVVSSAGGAIADGASAVGGAIADGAGYVADGAVSVGNAALGYGGRAVDGAVDLARGAGNLIADGADAVYHGLTDWHFEGRDRRNGPAPGAGDLNGNGWERQPDWMAELHQDPDHAGREVKYVNADGRESIRYEDAGADGGEVTDDRYRGTYNYVNPGNWDQLQNQGQVMGVPVGGALEWAGRGIGHAALDILPWALGGTVRGPG